MGRKRKQHSVFSLLILMLRPLLMNPFKSVIIKLNVI